MTSDRDRSAAGRGALASLALGALVLGAAADAAADGERSPMLGGAILGGRGPAESDELVGIGLETAWWWGRLALAPEGAVLWNAREGDRALTLGASARLRLHEQLLPALFEPRDVELGLELHGIAQRTWWSGDSVDEGRTGYGVGIAVRMRGDSDDFPLLLAESRLFVRVVRSERTPAEAARTMAPAGMEEGELTVLVGLGAAFGAGDPRYLERFRLQQQEIPISRGR